MDDHLDEEKKQSSQSVDLNIMHVIKTGSCISALAHFLQDLLLVSG